MQSPFARNAFAAQGGRPSRKEGELAKAIANGHLHEGASFEDLEAFQKIVAKDREAYAQERYGLTSEELAEKQRQENAEIARREFELKAIQQKLDDEGIVYPAGSSSQELQMLLEAGAAKVDQEDTDAPKTFGSKKTIILVVLILLIFGGGGIYYITKRKSTKVHD